MFVDIGLMTNHALKLGLVMIKWMQTHKIGRIASNDTPRPTLVVTGMKPEMARAATGTVTTAIEYDACISKKAVTAETSSVDGEFDRGERRWCRLMTTIVEGNKEGSEQ